MQFKVYSLVAFSICTVQPFPCIQFPNIFITPEGNPMPIKQRVLLPVFAQSQATAQLLSVSVDVPALDRSHKWNQTVCALCVWRLSFAVMLSRLLRVVAWIRIPFLVWSNHISLYGQTTFYISFHSLMDIQVVSPFWLLFVNNTAVNIHVQDFVLIAVFISFEYVPRSSMAGSQ